MDAISEFQRRHNPRIVPYYESRDGRNEWAASTIREFPGTRVLNLGGGGKRHLASHLGAEYSVHEIDMAGDCDTLLNLDEVDRLPFEDDAFDTCCAFEVLEHLEKFHHILEEMRRVTKSTLFVSLPNSAVEFISILRKRRIVGPAETHGVYSKFYGLPLTPPPDRHRWWLTFEDIIRFFVHYESLHGCSIELYVPDAEPTRLRRAMRALMGDRLFYNLYVTNVWARITL